MNIRIENNEIVQAVTQLVTAQIPGAKVGNIEFTRQKGGKVYATVTVELGAKRDG